MSRLALPAPLRALMAVIVVLTLTPPASLAATSTAFHLAPGNDLRALATTASGNAFAAVFRPFAPGTDLSQQGTYVYEVSPSGSVEELPAKIPIPTPASPGSLPPGRNRSGSRPPTTFSWSATPASR
jgi:hypothetical protein